MDDTFQLHVVASDKIFYKGPCEMIVVPAIDGYRGVMAHHEPMVTVIIAGEMRFRVDGEWKYAAVSDGFIDVNSENVTVIADTVELPEEIDIKRAEQAKERAEERLRQKQSMQEYIHTQAALSRAMARLKATKSRH